MRVVRFYMLTKKLLSKISKWAVNHPEVATVFIFGSRAKGNNQKDSDIDIAVALDESYINEDAFTHWMYLSSNFKAELYPSPLKVLEKVSEVCY